MEAEYAGKYFFYIRGSKHWVSPRRNGGQLYAADLADTGQCLPVAMTGKRKSKTQGADVRRPFHIFMLRFMPYEAFRCVR